MAVILIVEDDVFIREVAEMMIQDYGHQTLAAYDVDEALAFLRSPQHIDALFTDIYLRNWFMAAAISRFRPLRCGRHLRVLYTTGNNITDKMKALADRRHALPAQAIHATSAPGLSLRLLARSL